MPSNYASKLGKPRVDVQNERRASARTQPRRVRCTNCGTEHSEVLFVQFSKCKCGGTFQRFGALP